VVQYSAAWSEIQAEWFYEKSPGTTKEDSVSKGFVVSNIHNESWLRFSNVSFGKSQNTFTANILLARGSGQLEVRVERLDGPLLSVLEVPGMKDQSHYRELSSKLNEMEGTRDIYLVFTGERKSEISLDWISFSR